MCIGTINYHADFSAKWWHFIYIKWLPVDIALYVFSEGMPYVYVNLHWDKITTGIKLGVAMEHEGFRNFFKTTTC